MKILFVCLGNICRSPTAEIVFREIVAREAPDLRIEVDSAGTAAYHVGSPPDSRTRQAALRRGYDMSALRARVVEPQASDARRAFVVLHRFKKLKAEHVRQPIDPLSPGGILRTVIIHLHLRRGRARTI